MNQRGVPAVLGPRERVHRAPEPVVTELKAEVYPNIVERVVRLILHIAGIVALVLVSLLMLLLLTGLAKLGQAVSDIRTPAPVVTGCPFGDGQCGG